MYKTRGTHRGEIYNNNGVFQGVPIIADLCVMKYETNPPDDIRYARPEMEIRNPKEEHAWATKKEIYRFRLKGEPRRK